MEVRAVALAHSTVHYISVAHQLVRTLAMPTNSSTPYQAPMLDLQDTVHHKRVDAKSAQKG